jgi:uncharacterized protein (TIGR03435 family)
VRQWILVPTVLLLQSFVIAQSARPSFDVASIKRSTGESGGAVDVPTGDSGHIVMRRMAALGLVLRAYPLDTTPPEIVGLPNWAETERYDVEVRTDPGHTHEELQQMWRTLLAERMKLSARYDTKDLPAYDLVVSRPDGKLGPNIRPSRLDCSRPQAPPKPRSADEIRQIARNVCSRAFTDVDSTTYAGGIQIGDLIRAAGLLRAVDRPIVDRTGLSGYFEVTLRYRRGPARAGAPPDEIPEVFTAVQDQLGLKLQPARTKVQVVVVDHIERPGPN